jgi:hypothetical protein
MKQIIVVTLCLISIHTQAQKRSMQFSIAAEAAVMATEQAFSVYNLGFGGSGKVLYPTGQRDYLTGSVGVIAFSGRSGPAEVVFADAIKDPSTLAAIKAFSKGINVAHPSLTNITAKVGYKYFIDKTFSTEIEAGYTYSSVKKLFESIAGDIGGYVFSGGFGFLIAKKMDIGMRYELFETTASRTNYTSYVGLRTLLMLDFRK